MDRFEFIIVMMIVLIATFSLGWGCHWVLTRFARIKGGKLDEMDQLAQMLHDAEEMRDQAIAYIEQREKELTNQIAQIDAELRATMEGLREARGQNEEMRNYIKRIQPAIAVSTPESAGKDEKPSQV